MLHNPTRYYSLSEKLVAALIVIGGGGEGSAGLKQLVADNNNRTTEYIFPFPCSYSPAQHV